MNISGSQIRLRYASLILFFSRVFSIFTGALFVLLITRKLPVEQYGLWRMINNYLVYTFVLADVSCYWLPRTIARGINTSKTGLVLSTILGSVATIIYVSLAFWFSIYFNQSLFLLLVAAVQVILYYIQFALESISSGYAPQFIGYTRISLELVKICVGFLLVFYLRTELLGAIICVIASQIVTIFILFVLNRRALHESKMDFNVAKLWLKRSWIPIFNSTIGIISGLDAVIIRLLSKSEIPIAYFGVALTIIGVVANSNAMVYVLYPRLLARASKTDVEATIRLMYMFGIPMSIFMFFYAEPALAVYGLKYLVAIDTIKVAALASLLFTLNPVLDAVILGLESKDVEKLSLKETANTMLFKLPLLNCLIYIFHLIVVYILQLGAQGYVEASLRWIVSTTITQMMGASIKLIILRRNLSISTHTIISLLRYFILSLAVTAISLKIWDVTPVERIIDLLLSFIPSTLFIGAAYFILLTLIDGEVKGLIKQMINELKERLC